MATPANVLKFLVSEDAKRRLSQIAYDNLDRKINAEIAEVHAKVDREMGRGLLYRKGIHCGQQT